MKFLRPIDGDVLFSFADGKDGTYCAVFFILLGKQRRGFCIALSQNPGNGDL